MVASSSGPWPRTARAPGANAVVRAAYPADGTMPTTVALERFVGPVIHAHGRGQVGVHEGVFDTKLVIPVHVHDVTVVSLMLSGVATERVEEGTREISAQDLI